MSQPTSPVDKDWLNNDYEIKEQDRFLPIANVGRVMKKALPSHAKLSKESKECVQECVSEFISFITSQAADKCKLEKRKTLNGEDILWSMYILGFENYAETLKIYLAKYRQYEQEEAMKRPPKKKKRKKSTTMKSKLKNESSEDYLETGDYDDSELSSSYSKSTGEGSPQYFETVGLQSATTIDRITNVSEGFSQFINFDGTSTNTLIPESSGFVTLGSQKGSYLPETGEDKTRKSSLNEASSLATLGEQEWEESI